MTPDQARRYVEVLDLYEGDLETLVGETRADKPGLTSALNPHLHDMARGVATVREKITADAETMTRMIAGMRAEYRAEQQVHDEVWLPLCGWYDHGTAQFFAVVVGEGVTRIVRRYVTEPEEA